MVSVDGVSEITGKVWKIVAKVGDQLEEGDIVVILESMKMEVPVQAIQAGVVTAILVAEEDAVTEGDTVFTLAT